MEKADAIGVAGYITNIQAKRSALRDFFSFVFRTHYRYPVNRCRLLEYPAVLTRIIECEWLNGGTSAYRKEIFREFKFDENLKGYSYMEDVLFSHSIFKKYPGSLFMTPHARCIHKVSPKNYEDNRALEEHKRRCRKYVLVRLYGMKGLYVLVRLYGMKGLLLYYWQNIGLTLINLTKKLKNFYM